MTSRASNSGVAPVGYLLLDTVPVPLMLLATGVLGIVRAAEWRAASPLPFGALVPVNFCATEPSWVLRIGGAARSINALVGGRVRVEYLRTDALLPMPRLNYGGSEFFSELVVANGKPFALVVNIDILFRTHLEMGK
jgi:hypothetical protein